MSLPTNNTPWLPSGWEGIYREYAMFDAWYSGDPERLANLYGNYLYNPLSPSSAFWSAKTRSERRVVLHVPLAGDISAASTNLLFGEQPKIRWAAGQESQAARLEEIISQGSIWGVIQEAAETASALGGVFVKVNWDLSLSPNPIISVAQPDSAIPDFRAGMLTGATFWREVDQDGGGTAIYRTIERHEHGTIITALYRGTSDNLGVLVGEPEVVETGLRGLACVYIPNLRPNRRHRGSDLGQSDYAGSESLMDSLDETWTSLVRDIRLARARLTVPEGYLQNISGTPYFDLDQEIYSPVSALMSTTGGTSQDIVATQFAIRAEEHLAVCDALTTRIITVAGYSPQTFGLNISGSAESGTALAYRERKSVQTTARKSLYWKPALERICEIALTIDRLHLGGRVEPARPTVEMQDGVPNDPLVQAQTINQLSQARAASTETLVRMLHPDWVQDQVAAEVERISQEQGTALPDAMQVGALG